MQGFTFRLQPLLDQKLDLYERAKAALAEKQAVVREQETALLRLLERERRIEESVFQARDGLLAPSGTNACADVQRKNEYLNALRQDLGAAHKDTLVQKFAVEEAELNLNEAQAYAAECFREAEKLSKYRERLEERFFAEARRREELEQDELGTNMYLSRRAGA